MDKITVAVPCYNEEPVLDLFYSAITAVAKEFPDTEFEFLFIDDGSRDNTLGKVQSFAQKDSRVKYISFSRNFGKEAGIYAGLENATGDYVVIMDADLQDPPSLLPEMYRAITEEGYDSVGSRRVTRKGEPPLRSFFARLFYKIINKISDARHRRRRPGLPDDEPKGGRRNSLHGRIQPLFQGYLRLDRLPEEVVGI